MNRTVAALATALAVVVVITGCSQPTPQVNVSTGAQTTGVSVSGTGSVTGTPDTVTVSIAVAVTADDVATAVGDNARTTERVIAAIRDAGVAEADVQTTSYSLTPEYDYTDSGRRPLGYRATNQVTVTVRDVTAAGQVIDDAVAAGGDATEVSNIGFDLENDDEALAQARQQAFDDARRKAEQFASLAGRTLGEVVSVEETTASAPVPLAADVAPSSSGATTVVQPGEVETSVTVAVRWALD